MVRMCNDTFPFTYGVLCLTDLRTTDLKIYAHHHPPIPGALNTRTFRLINPWNGFRRSTKLPNTIYNFIYKHRHPGGDNT